jgi:hypothetical protein
VLIGVMLNVAVHNDQRLTWALYSKDLLDPFTVVGYGRTILVCYACLWCFGRLFAARRYTLAVLSVLGFIVLDVLVRYAIEQMFIGPVFGRWQYYKGIPMGAYFTETVFYSALGIFICFFLKIINDFFRNEMIREAHVRMELQFLKTQINPHFLFNTINNLYGLSLSNPQTTPDAILLLANMMRYMLYESNEDFVSLSKEIAYLRSNIALQKMRYEGEIFVLFTVQGNVGDKKIAPLLLISFIENAFKHGDVYDSAAPLSVNLRVEGNALHFSVRNKIGHHQKDRTGGIGLENVKRRLDLLYPKRHTLKITNDSVIFNAELTIPHDQVHSDR